MKRKFLLVVFYLVLIISCKTENDVRPKGANFLVDVKVDGAKEVKVDTATSTIQIVLPEIYTSDLVYLNLILVDGATLTFSPLNELYSTNKLGFHFRGAYPEKFIISLKNGYSKLYTVYVEHLGKLTAELTSDIQLYPGPTDFGLTYIKYHSGIGTVPEKPESSKNLISTLSDQVNNVSISGNYDVGLSFLSFENASSLLYSKNIVLNLAYGEKNFQLAQQRIKRAPRNARIDLNSRHLKPLGKGKKLNIEGGFFLADLKYTVKIQHDFTENLTSIRANYLNNYSLDFEIPSHIEDGTYLFSVLEADSLIASAIHTVSNDTINTGIGQVWTSDTKCPSTVIFDMTPDRIYLNIGDTFYVNPIPLQLQSRYTPLDPNRALPDLELKRGDEKKYLKPKVKVDICYSDYSIFMLYGEYKIPKDLAKGKYEARLIYASGRQSFPYPYVITIN